MAGLADEVEGDDFFWISDDESGLMHKSLYRSHYTRSTRCGIGLLGDVYTVREQDIVKPRCSACIEGARA